MNQTVFQEEATWEALNTDKKRKWAAFCAQCMLNDWI